MLLFLRFYLRGYKIFCRFVSETIKLYEMKQRTIIELLELLDENIRKDEVFKGMCVSIDSLGIKSIINEKEVILLFDYIEANRTNYTRYGYWFPRGEKQPRIDWINEQIKQLKN